MQSFRRFFLILLVAGAVCLPAAVTIDFFWKQKDRYADFLVDTLNARQTDILYFGDSTIRFHGDRDESIAGIDQIFQTVTGLKLCTIASPGFSAVLYSQYVRLLDKTRYRPGLVIIPINLRSFNGSSIMRPALSFPLRQIYIRYRCTGRLDLADYLRYRYLGFEERLTEEWNKLPVVYEGVSLGTNRSILEESRIREVLDYAPEREPLYARQLAIKFRYHYMAPVGTDDSMFGYLDETIRYLKGRGIPVLFYITPINFRDGKKYVGPAFTRRNEKTIEIIKGFMTARGVTCLDLANTLDAPYFVHKRDVYEHLNYKGRQFVAQQVARAALELLPGKHR
jgi:hypothetical protein